MEKNDLKTNTQKAFGLLCIALGLFILIFAVDYAYANILSSSNDAWVGIYVGFVVLGYSFMAALFVGVLLLGFQSLMAITEMYKHRR